MQTELFRGPQEKITLRHYQQSAVNSVYAYLRAKSDNPCVVIPTGGGKTPVIAQICSDAVKLWGGRVLILAHVKELLEQSADKLRMVCPDIAVGIYSAGLGKRDTKQKIIVAGIQSIYKRATELDPFDLIIIDEAHLIPPDGEGMYRQFLAEAKAVNPSLRIIGLTATPFRLSSGPICTPDSFLNAACYEIGVKQLIVEGFLSPLISKSAKAKADCGGLHVRAGEFIPAEIEALMGDQALVESAVAELLEHTRDRRSVLIFASGVPHGMQVASAIESSGQSCHFLCGETPDAARANLVAGFKRQDFKYLCNVNVLTTGFDAPAVDCIALLRPTLSPGLYYQMVGRGFRLAPGKSHCLVLDYGGNVMRHGPVDALCVPGGKAGSAEKTTQKECPNCQTIINVSYRICPNCNFEFPRQEREIKHDRKPSEAGILSDQVTDTVYEVDKTFYGVHTKKGSQIGDPQTMRVEYRVSFKEFKNEWICFEHTGFARDKAEKWWQARSNVPVPDTAQDAVDLADTGCLTETRSITCRAVPGQRFDTITNYELGDKPDAEQLPTKCTLTDYEIPF